MSTGPHIPPRAFDRADMLLALIADPKGAKKRLDEIRAATAESQLAIETAKATAARAADDKLAASQLLEEAQRRMAAVEPTRKQAEADIAAAAEREIANQARAAELDTLSGELAARDRALLPRENALAAREQRCDEREAQIAQREAALKQARADHDQNVSALRAVIRPIAS